MSPWVFNRTVVFLLDLQFDVALISSAARRSSPPSPRPRPRPSAVVWSPGASPPPLQPRSAPTATATEPRSAPTTTSSPAPTLLSPATVPAPTLLPPRPHRPRGHLLALVRAPPRPPPRPRQSAPGQRTRAAVVEGEHVHREKNDY